MAKKTVLIAIALLFVMSTAIFESLVAASTQNGKLSARELQTVSLVNGTSAYDYDLELERIALDHKISDYAFRSAGSPGANYSANWIKTQFENLGLETRLESFEFTTWNLPSQPTLIVDEDGNEDTVDDQIAIRSFQSNHLSWNTSEDGVFADLVILPLPANATYNTFVYGSFFTYDSAAWNAIDTTGKILLIGREVNWFAPLRRVFENKLASQPPAVLIYTYWYSWMNFTPPFFGSMGGYSLWSLRMPVGVVDYDDGLLIRKMEDSLNVSAKARIPATIGTGTHYNVVAELRGTVNPEKRIIVSGHYDTVMSAGFCDNGAGTAGVIELARIFSEAARIGIYAPEQTLVFIAFTGEELGFVGAIEYIKQHKVDMTNVTAVINLDCIGHNVLRVSETFPDDSGLDLDELVLKAAEDLGVTAESEESGGSDQEAFRNPAQTNAYFKKTWGVDPGINDTARVKTSTMLSSYPLFYSDKLRDEEAGWIHTEYDNSTSTATLNWVTVDTLEAHLRVATLSILRVLAAEYNPFMSQLITGTAIASAVVAAAIFIEHSKVKTGLVKLYNHVNYYIDTKELVYTFGLTVFLLFSSFSSHTRIGRLEIMVKGVPTAATMRYFGTPFEMLGIPLQLSTTGQELDFLASELTMHPEANTPVVLWPGLLLNTALFFILSFTIVYLAMRIWSAYTSRRLIRTDDLTPTD